MVSVLNSRQQGTPLHITRQRKAGYEAGKQVGTKFRITLYAHKESKFLSYSYDGKAIDSF